MKWTPAKLKILKEQYPTIQSVHTLAKQWNSTYYAVKSKALKIGLHRKVSGNINRAADPDVDNFIKENYLVIPKKTMAQMLGVSDTVVYGRLKRLNLKVPKAIADYFQNSRCYQPGMTPMNKGKKQTEFMSKEGIERTKLTRFKKGNLPGNTLYDGAITLRRNHIERGEQPHLYIRVKLGVWKELQIYNWEKVNGPVPPHCILACKDGNTLNCKVSNWYVMSKADNARRNADHHTLSDWYVARMLAGKDRYLREMYLSYPELIEAKRQLIILNRTTNEQRRAKTESRKLQRRSKAA